MRLTPTTQPSQLTSTTTTISCSNSFLVPSYAIYCTALVAGSNPTRTVVWSANGGEVSFTSSSCSLSLAGTCFVSVLGKSAGSVTLTASYLGDQNNAPSTSGAFSLSVNGYPNPGWFAGAFYPYVASEGSTIITTITVPPSEPNPYEWFWVGESAYDNVGGYDQLGFATGPLCANLSPGSVPNCSSPSSPSWVVYGSNNTYCVTPACPGPKLTPGMTYTFSITAANGMVSFAVYQGSDQSSILWFAQVPEKGVDHLIISSVGPNFVPSYTVYEEVHATSTQCDGSAGDYTNCAPEFNIIFNNNYWAGKFDNSINPTTWKTGSNLPIFTKFLGCSTSICTWNSNIQIYIANKAVIVCNLMNCATSSSSSFLAVSSSLSSVATREDPINKNDQVNRIQARRFTYIQNSGSMDLNPKWFKSLRV